MIIPIALTNDGSTIDEDILKTRFEQQENWTVKFIDTRYGTMLQVNGTFTSERHDITINLDSNDRIDTRKAIDNEPTLQPKENMTKSSYDDLILKNGMNGSMHMGSVRYLVVQCDVFTVFQLINSFTI